MPGIDDDWSDDEINTNLDAGQVPHVEDATSPKNSAVTGGDDETAENITALRAEQSSRAHALHETLPVAFPNVSFAEEESFSNSSISRTTSTTTQQAALNTAEAKTTTILEGADNQPFDPMVFARPLKSYARTAESSSIGIVLSECFRATRTSSLWDKLALDSSYLSCQIRLLGAWAAPRLQSG